MARYINTVSSRKTPAELNQTVSSYLTAQGFRQIDPAQNIWKKGMGLLMGPQFVRYEVQPGALRLARAMNNLIAA